MAKFWAEVKLWWHCLVNRHQRELWTWFDGSMILKCGDCHRIFFKKGR